jgi:hypothetical protein
METQTSRYETGPNMYKTGCKVSNVFSTDVNVFAHEISNFNTSSRMAVSWAAENTKKFQNYVEVLLCQ